MVEWSRAKFCDVVNLFLGTILFFSPGSLACRLAQPNRRAVPHRFALAVGVSG